MSMSAGPSEETLGPLEPVADAGASPAAVNLTLDVEHGKLSVGVDLEHISQTNSSAVLAVKLPGKHSQFMYAMEDEVRETIAQIGRRYSVHDDLHTGLDEPVDVITSVAYKKATTHGVANK